MGCNTRGVAIAFARASRFSKSHVKDIESRTMLHEVIAFSRGVAADADNIYNS